MKKCAPITLVIVILLTIVLTSCTSPQQPQQEEVKQGDGTQWTDTALQGETQSVKFSGVELNVMNCNVEPICCDGESEISGESITPSDGNALESVYIFTYTQGETEDMKTYYDKRSRVNLEGTKAFTSSKGGVYNLSSYTRLKTLTDENGTVFNYYEYKSDLSWCGLILGFNAQSGKGFAIIACDYGNSETDQRGEPLEYIDFSSISFNPESCDVDSAALYDEYANRESEKDEQIWKERLKKRDEGLEKPKNIANTESPSKSNDSASKKQANKDEVIVETDGKTVYKVCAASSSIHFSGSYSGTGNFIIWVLDSNQEHYKLVTNEIGDFKVDKSVSVTKGATYYIQIECSYGNWTMNWTGTGGR